MLVSLSNFLRDGYYSVRDKSGYPDPMVYNTYIRLMDFELRSVVNTGVRVSYLVDVGVQ